MTYIQELNFAKSLALKAGAIMRKHFSLEIKSEMKDNITPVTIADTEINSLVIKSIHKQFPGHAIIGEEESSDVESAHYTWICDPLDGTIPYSIGMPTSMFSLALYKEKKPILGVLYDPYMDRLYHSIHGAGSYMNETKIQTSKGGLKKGDCMGIILFDPDDVDERKLIKPLLQKDIRFMQVHSFVYVVSYIASGKFKGSVMVPAYVWDRAAAKIILVNAGGMMTDEKGNDVDVFSDNARMIIASNGDSHDELLQLVQGSLL